MTSDTDYSERADGNDATPLAVSGMIARIMSHNPIETVSEDIYDFEHPTYPRVALREAILNAFCHSDYRIASPRLVKQYADRIEITSPGGFLGGVTAENILHHRPVTRNPRLVDALVRLRMVNRTNLGTERIVRRGMRLEMRFAHCSRICEPKRSKMRLKCGKRSAVLIVFRRISPRSGHGWRVGNDPRDPVEGGSEEWT